MNSDIPVYAYDFDGDRYDVGEKLASLKQRLNMHLKTQR